MADTGPGQGVVVSVLLMSVGVVYVVSGISLLVCLRGSGVDEWTTCWTAEDDAALAEWVVAQSR
jgi:hypothetical protein